MLCTLLLSVVAIVALGAVLVGRSWSAAVLVVGVDLVPVPRGTKKLDLDHDGRRLSSGLADTDAFKTGRSSESTVDDKSSRSTDRVPGRRTERVRVSTGRRTETEK